MVTYTSTTPRPKSVRRAAKYSSPRPTAQRRLNFTPTTVARVPVRSSPRLAAKIGFTPNTATDYKRITVDQWAGTLRQTKTLYTDELINIPQKSSNEINGRERAMINCLGFTLRTCFTNLAPYPIAVRMAVVSPIDRNDVSIVNFFRGYVNNRSLPFTSNTDASQLLYNPINRDAFTVLWEKKLMLPPTGSGYGSDHSTFETYVKLNRQLRYSGVANSDCTDKVYLIAWFDYPVAVAVASPPAANVRYQRFAITHWKDPK